LQHEWGEGNAYKLPVGKAGKKRPLGRPRHRLEGDIKIDIGEIGSGMGWIGLAQNMD
jgi:hypothetical protein